LLEEGSSHFFLMFNVQLGPGTGHVEYVGCGLALRVNARHLHVATELGHGGAAVVKQSRPALADNLDQGAV